MTDLYTMAQDLRALVPLRRIIGFKALGGRFQKPERPPMVFDELWWSASLAGLTGSGLTCRASVDDWISQALARTPRRAADCRPECHCNEQQKPPLSETAATETAPNFLKWR